MKSKLNIGVVGATGAVGRVLLSILESRNFPVQKLVPFASARSEGKAIEFQGNTVFCQILKPQCFDGLDMVFFDASDAISKEWVPQAVEAGAWVVDNSSTYRLEDDVLLVVPEVNGELLEARLKSKSLKDFTPKERIVTGPNCVAAPLALALKPILDRWGIQRIVVSTYQATSGAGAAAEAELYQQTQAWFNKEEVKPQVFKHPIAFNCIPHIGSFQPDGYTSEEHKIVTETRKLLNLPHLKISATAVRVPTFSCHSESISVECERPFQIEEVVQALSNFPGIILEDNPQENVYPMARGSGSKVQGASGRDSVYVGRVRQDLSVENGLNLWVVSDNLRKGAALNAVQLGEVLLKTLW